MNAADRCVGGEQHDGLHLAADHAVGHVEEAAERRRTPGLSSAMEETVTVLDDDQLPALRAVVGRRVGFVVVRLPATDRLGGRVAQRDVWSRPF